MFLIDMNPSLYQRPDKAPRYGSELNGPLTLESELREKVRQGFKLDANASDG